MFDRLVKTQQTGTVIEFSANHILDKAIATNPTVQSLYQLGHKISKIYGIELWNIKLRYDLAKPERCSILLFNSMAGANSESVDLVNVKPIDYFKAHGASMQKEQAKYPYWSFSSLTFPIDKIQSMMDGLQFQEWKKSESRYMTRY